MNWNTKWANSVTEGASNWPHLPAEQSPASWPPMQETSQQPIITNPKPSNPWDTLSQDELLAIHLKMRNDLTELKNSELKLRKYIVDRAFPAKVEGTNTLELNNGYQLKAQIKFNYKLSDNDTVEKTLDKISAIGNQGKFIAERLVSWTPNFLLTEYRNLTASAEDSKEAQEILAVIGEMLIVDDAAPTLEIKEPKKKKKGK